MVICVTPTLALQTRDLAAQIAAKNVVEGSCFFGSGIQFDRLLQLVRSDTVLAHRINCVPQIFVCIFLTTQLEVTSDGLQALSNVQWFDYAAR